MAGRRNESHRVTRFGFLCSIVLAALLSRPVEGWTLQLREPAGSGTVEIEELSPQTTKRTTVDQREVSGPVAIEVERIGFFDVRLELDGQVPRVFSLSPALGHGMLTTPEPEPASSWTLDVRDSQGRPISGVLVEFWPVPGAQAVWQWRLAERLARTGEDGTVTFPVASGERGSLSLWHPNYTARRIETEALRKTEIVLSPGHPKVLRVVSPAGRVAARVEARVDGVLVGRSDEEGRVRLRIDEASSRVDLRAPDGAWRSLDLREGGHDSRATEDTWTVRLEEPFRIQGKVLDAESAKPIEGALVWSAPSRGEARSDGPAWTTSDAEGHYSLTLATPPESLVAASPAHSSEVRPLPGGESGPAFLLSRVPARLEGRVVDLDGRPVERAIVSTELLDPRASFSKEERFGLEAWTRSDGTFEIERLPLGLPLRVRVQRESFSPLAQTIEPGRLLPEASPVTLRLERGVVVSGEVTSPRGEPLPKALVRMRGEGDSRDAQPDPAGRFRVENLADGSYRLFLRGEGRIPRSIDFEVAGEALDLGALILEESPRISGRVVDPSGRGLAGATVQWPEADTTVESRVEGRFTFDEVPRLESVTFEARAPGYLRERSTWDFLQATSEELEIALEPAARLEASLTTEDGSPVDALSIHLLGSAGEIVEFLEPSKGGSVFADHLEPMEEAYLQAQPAGWSPTLSAPFALIAGETTRIEMTLSPGIEIRGEVVDPLGAPVLGASIHVMPDPLSNRMALPVSARSDGDGRFVLGGLEEGPLLLRVDHPRFSSREQVVEVAPGRGLRLVMEPAGDRTLRARVVDASGNPVAGVRLVMRTDDARPVVEKRGPVTVVTSTGSRHQVTEITGATGEILGEDLAAAIYVVELGGEIVARVDLRSRSVEDLEIVID